MAMKQVPIRLGPLALLLTVITICMAVLGVLTLSTAQSDLLTAEKYSRAVAVRYRLEALGQAFLEKEEEIPWDEADSDGIYWKTFIEGDASLHIGLIKSEEAGCRVVSWRFARDWQEQNSMGQLWQGE